MPTTDAPAARTRRSPLRRASAVLTALAMVGVLWLYTTSGLLAPGWAVAGLLVLWVGFAVAAWFLQRRRGALSLLVPLVAVATWFAVLTLGEGLLGWTA